MAKNKAGLTRRSYKRLKAKINSGVYMPKVHMHAEVDACQAQPTLSVTPNFQDFSVQAESLAVDEMVRFYNGNDVAKLTSSDMQKVRELQDSNDRLHRQISQLEKEMKTSNDALTLLAEKERCLIIIARNTGEILKTHISNEERLNRIAQLEAENIRLKEEIQMKRDQFVDTHEVHPRSKHAADFFLIKAKIEKNTAELLDLTQQ